MEKQKAIQIHSSYSPLVQDVSFKNFRILAGEILATRIQKQYKFLTFYESFSLTKQTQYVTMLQESQATYIK